MNVDRAVLAVAGTMVLVSVLLTALVSTWWLLLTAFVGVNLLQSSVTGFCPAAILLSRLGVPGGCAFGTSSGSDASADLTEAVPHS
jgi:hypothetical protein